MAEAWTEFKDPTMCVCGHARAQHKPFGPCRAMVAVNMTTDEFCDCPRFRRRKDDE